MGFWIFDDKTQLALIMAGLIGATGAAGCDDGRPVPSDAQVDGVVADPLPVDSDPVPPDASPDYMVSDMLPPDARPDVIIADPLPPDAGSASLPNRGAGGFAEDPGAGKQSAIPLPRDLRAAIQARRLADGSLKLLARAPTRPGVRYSWKVSHGALDRDDAAAVRWQVPATPGRYLAQLTVRDGDRTVSVEVFVYNVD